MNCYLLIVLFVFVLIEIEVINAMTSDPRVDYFGGSATGSHRHQLNFASDRYWEQCLFCGTSQVHSTRLASNINIVKAHIIPSYNNCLYPEFGPPRYADNLNVHCERNFLPLCGTSGQLYTCHDLFDKHMACLLWQPFESVYYLHISEKVAHDRQRLRSELPELKSKVIQNIPKSCFPYKRLLAARAVKGITSIGIDTELKRLLFVPLDVGSVSSVPQDTRSVSSSQHESTQSSHESDNVGARKRSRYSHDALSRGVRFDTKTEVSSWPIAFDDEFKPGNVHVSSSSH